MKMICEECGKEYDEKDAEKKFDHYYADSSKWKYRDVIHRSLCFEDATEDADERFLRGELIDPNVTDDEIAELRREHPEMKPRNH